MLLPLAYLTLLALPGAQDPPETSTVNQQPAPSEGAVHYSKLLGEYDEANLAWTEKVQALAAEAEAEGRELTDYPAPPQAEFMPRFLAAAGEYAGTEDAVDFLVWVVDNGWADLDATRKALATIEKSHLASPKLVSMVFAFTQLGYLMGEEEGRVFARKAEEQTTSPLIRAMAAFAVRERVLREEPLDSKAYRTARARMMELMEPLKGSDAELARAMILAEIEVRETFGIGMTAPDIVGVDLDGVPFKLSDSKGKVLLVDFWGDW